jgi:hypothetical protein
MVLLFKNGEELTEIEYKIKNSGQYGHLEFIIHFEVSHVPLTPDFENKIKSKIY